MADLLAYDCPCCGGKIEYSSTDQKMKCPFCDSEFDLDTLNAYAEAQQASNASSDMEWEEDAGSEWEHGEADNLRVYKCKSCGGEILAEETTGASKCPYCDSPVIMSGAFSGDLKPDFVIPFKLDKAAAKEALKKHMEGKKLLPDVFRKENHIDEIKGVYVPVWLFDADATANMRFHATKVKHSTQGNFDVTETSHYSISRAGKIDFRCVPVDGSAKMDDTLMESLEPFDFGQAVPFQTAFLSGYLADKYDVSSDDSKRRANERITKSIQLEFEKTVTGYSTVNKEAESIQLNNSKVKYALYPVWMLNTSWNGQNYLFAMNGQSGKFVGDLPADKGKSWKTFFIWAIIGLIVGLLLDYFIGTMPIAAIVCALIFGFAARGILLSELKSVVKNNEAKEYIAKGSFNLSTKKDLFLYKKTERKEKPKPNAQ